MNERLRFSFTQNGRPINIDQLVPIELDRGGLVLNGETSAWPRGLRFGFEGVGAFKDRLDLLRKQTANGTHRFNVEREKDVLNFTTDKPDRIPIGTYEYRLRISDLDIKNSEGRVRFKSGEPTAD